MEARQRDGFAAAFSQYPKPELREWAANPLSPGMWETWFGPLIKEVEQRIIDHQADPQETLNIAAVNPQRVTALTAQLNAGWRQAL